MTILPNRLSGLSGGKVSSSSLALYGSPLSAAITFFGNAGTTNYNTTKTAAKLNWILLDEQLNYVPSGSNFIQAQNLNTLQVLTSGQLVAPKSGYLMVYVSNETPDVSAAFDNLRIHHRSGPLVQEDDYYAFGLGMAAISSKAAGSMTNKLKYNGKEEQRQEFSDGSGVDWLDYGWRMYDYQTGRWGVIDAKAEKYTRFAPYCYAVNNPLIYIDPDGRDVYEIHQASGKITLIPTKFKQHSYYLVGEDGNKTFVGTFKCNKIGLVKLPSSFKDTDGEGSAFGFHVKEENEGRAYIKGSALASLFGVLSETKTTDLMINGFSYPDGSSPAPSISHKEGKNGDLRYLRKDESGGAVLLQDKQFDMSRQNEFNDSLKKFGWKNLLSERFVPVGRKNEVLLNHASHYSKSRHNNHLHLQGYAPNIQTVYMGGEIGNVTVTAQRKMQ